MTSQINVKPSGTSQDVMCPSHSTVCRNTLDSKTDYQDTTESSLSDETSSQPAQKEHGETSSDSTNPSQAQARPTSTKLSCCDERPTATDKNSKTTSPQPNNSGKPSKGIDDRGNSNKQELDMTTVKMNGDRDSTRCRPIIGVKQTPTSPQDSEKLTSETSMSTQTQRVVLTTQSSIKGPETGKIRAELTYHY